MPDRRRLHFDNLDDAMTEVDRLLKGHVTLGRWSLGQICNHLATALRWSIDGFPTRAPWLVRQTVGRLAKRHVLRGGRMPDGVSIRGVSPPRADLDDRAEAEALRATLRLFAAEPGPFAAHPFFGRLTAEETRRLHCIHAAHHLGFVVPEPAPAEPLSPGGPPVKMPS